MLVSFVISKSSTPRIERKYKLPSTSTYLLTSSIKTAPLGLNSIYYKRQVNNIYFDTPSLSLFQSNLMGTARRSKIRIRWYGRFSPQLIQPNLEIKVKIGNLIYKHVFPLKKIKLFSLNSRFIKAHLLSHDLPQEIKEAIKQTFPSLINSYTRSYFLSANKKIRLTLDENMHFYPQLSSNLSFTNNYISSATVIELKYNPDNEYYAQKLIQHFPVTLQKNSKYSLGMAFNF